MAELQHQMETSALVFAQPATPDQPVRSITHVVQTHVRMEEPRRLLTTFVNAHVQQVSQELSVRLKSLPAPTTHA
jgi:hypothetical protein